MTLHDDTPLFLSGSRFGVRYELWGNEREARDLARLITIDQTVEASEEVISPAIREQMLGRVEEFQKGESSFRATISFPVELLGDDCVRLLLTIFGISSLRTGIRVIEVLIPEDALRAWPGPRVGRHGLRACLGVFDRPLVCAVLKPVGLSVTELADLAYRFALGGVDLIKDDQALGDHPFCPFEERVARCVEAIAKATTETGRRCLYAPHVTAPWEALRRRAVFAASAGAGALLICPGLSGFDTIKALAEDTQLRLPIVSHPAMLGTYYVGQTSGLAPSVLFGQLPRLAGADVTIYPTYGAGFPISCDDCRAIAAACRKPWGHVKPIFPTAAGRMGAERIEEMMELYGKEVVFILGSKVRRDYSTVRDGCSEFMKQLSNSGRS